MFFLSNLGSNCLERRNIYIYVCVETLLTRNYLVILQDWKGDVTANDVTDYDGIVMRVRGDGRTYALNVQTQSIRDDDIHQSFFHTRGGPLWETVKVQF